MLLFLFNFEPCSCNCVDVASGIVVGGSAHTQDKKDREVAQYGMKLSDDA